MQNKGLIRFLAISFVLVCLFQLSFSFVTRNVVNNAKAVASKYVESEQGKKDIAAIVQQRGGENMSAAELQNLTSIVTDSLRQVREAYFLDSMANENVWLGFTFRKCQAREINLGLDLKGGMNVMLEVSTVDVVRALANYSTDEEFNKAIENALEQQKNTTNTDFVTLFYNAFISIHPAQDHKLAALFSSQLSGTTLNDDNATILAKLKEETGSAYERTYEILRKRIDKFGVAQPTIQRLQASERILVELPGVKDPQRVRKLLKGTAQLEFWATYSVDEKDARSMDEYNRVAGYLSATDEYLASLSSATPDTAAVADSAAKTDSTAVTTPATPNTPSANAANDPNSEQYRKEHPLMSLMARYERYPVMPPVVFRANEADTAAVNRMIAKGIAANKIKNTGVNGVRYLWSAKPVEEGSTIFELYAIKIEDIDPNTNMPRAKLDGSVITDARQDFSNAEGNEISMTMNSDGAHIWKNVTRNNVGKCVAIVLDDQVYSAPRVNGEISGGRSSITGNFTLEEAKDLANVLKSGKLPAPARIVQEAVVGPSLGQESIQKGLISFILAFVIVLIYMVVFYNRAGWVSVVALVTNVFLLMGVLASIGAVLTLPGIAGIVLTMAMAVDGNVIIYERIKEELRAGKSVANAVDEGFKNAMSAIIDGQLTTFLLGLVLIMFGSGTIQGFAVTLCIGIVTSLFTSIFITRLVIDWMLNHKKKLNFSFSFTENFMRNANIDFMGKRKTFYIIGICAIVLCFVGIFGRHLSMGIDFTGGRTYVVRFDKDVNVVDVRSDLAKMFDEAPEVKSYGPNNQVKITTNIVAENYYDQYRADHNLAATDTVTDEMVINEKLFNGTKTYFNKTESGKEITLQQFASADDYPYGIIQSEQVEATMATDMRRNSILAVLGGLLVIFAYIGIRFKSWRFGIGSVAALTHDTILIIGMFALLRGLLPFSLDVDQSFIAAVLTVIGYSINATVVIFDRVRENRKLYPKRDMISHMNDAINATLARTINTSGTTFFTLMMMFIFGGEVIRGFIFALLIGVLCGMFSSVCLACPIVYEVSKRREERLAAKNK
ncbi:MAG: protein translocase subunit SecDF [Bacteroidales bacterium]|nr:protein translocase subunit SecDF [Bacteroidales bacterium]